jgi:hypothetical protein
MDITYNAIGTADLARNNQTACEQSLNYLSGVIQSWLTNYIDVASSTITPRVWQGNQEPPFVSNSVSVSYTAGDGYGFPVGKLNLTLVGVNTGLDARAPMTVEFFDLNRLTVSLDANPTVRARFDITAIDPNAMAIFVYGVLGSVPYILDLVSDSYYNNTTSTY